jgi:16S rRNA C967 or C1407 C5-methylase (RsmB/RsmF family)/NOL1/NOP2/fmu family ribosome biogenesis protein
MLLFPEQFKKRMQEKLRDEWSSFEEAHKRPSPISIRLNPKKASSPIVGGEPIPWTKVGKYLAERPVFTLDPRFHAGCYYVQEASSMFLEQAFSQHVSADQPLRVLDLCAAPGGKSTHIISLLNSDSLLLSNEVIRSRVNVLSENIQKWGYPNVVVTNNDPKDFTTLEGMFDVIVIDAPCSGEGLFRKDPDAMREWSPDNVAICSQRQQRIIHDVWPALKENGILIYSTCTYNESEDENILKGIKEEFDVEFLSLNKGNDNIEEINEDGICAYRFYPHKVKGEGFFISVMRKKESAPMFSIKPSKSGFETPEKRVRDEISRWFDYPDAKLIQRDDLIQLIPGRSADLVLFLTQRLRVVYAGTYLATAKHSKLVPEHALALSCLLRRENFLSVELNEAQALHYLRRETINISTDIKGFALATYNGTPIGWMNVLPGRINNMYPQEWRIRMKI